MARYERKYAERERKHAQVALDNCHAINVFPVATLLNGSDAPRPPTPGAPRRSHSSGGLCSLQQERRAS